MKQRQLTSTELRTMIRIQGLVLFDYSGCLRMSHEVSNEYITHRRYTYLQLEFVKTVRQRTHQNG
jgi:hypothetical protein